ncbi:MAG: 30S ribosomal protein S20 [Rickettsiales bacterium]
MANCKSAKKSIRKIATRSARNKDRMSKIRTCIKKVEQAIEKKDSKLAATNFVEAQSELMKGVNKGLIKKNAASRKISRISHRIKKIA